MMGRGFHSAAVAVALVLLFAGGVTTAEESSVVPTESCGDYFLIPMAFGGDEERILWMLLDTGASHTVLDPDSLERVSGKRVASGKRVNLPRMTAGDIEFTGMGARLRSLDHLQLALGKPMDGILGFPVFRKVLLTMDYTAGEVRIRKGSLPAPDGKTVLRTIKEKRRPVVEVDFGGYRRAVLIDSGSAGGFVLRPSEELPLVAQPVPFDSSLRIDRVMLLSGARLDHDVRFGGARLAKPTVVVAESTELVGTRILKNFTVTYDQKRRRVLFEPTSVEPVEFPALREVGWALATRERGFEVVRVFDGLGAGRAGILSGDLVVGIDGEPVYERDLCDRTDKDHRNITVEIERDGKPLEFEVAIDTVVP